MFSATRIRLRWALLGAAAAALIVTTAALGGSGVGGVFNLGQINGVNGTTALNGKTTGAQLSVLNSSSVSTGVGITGRSSSATGAGVQGVNLAGGPALQAVVSSNAVAPLKVNSTHVVAGLHAANSDALAGHASSYFLPATATANDSAKLGGTVPNGYWRQGGNPVGATGVLGTTDNQALDLRVNGARALRLEPNATSPNLFGGFSGNGDPTGSGAFGKTIAGGGTLGNENQATDNFSTVGGGSDNVAGNLDGTASNAGSATVVGGSKNTASGFASTVGGGLQNTASGAYSFAAGRRAHATQDGSFVWGDSTDADVNSSGPNTFTVRASGGTYINGPEVVSGALSSGINVLTAGAATPNISAGNVFMATNGAPTTITDFTGAYAGQEITIVFTDNNTTVQHSATMVLKGAADFAAGTGDTLTLVTVSGNWYEVSRSVNH